MNGKEDVETLGEQLYSRIYPEHSEDAGKLTGEDISIVCFYDINQM